MGASTHIGSVPGYPIRGIIKKVDLVKGVVMVSLPLTSSGIVEPVKIPVAWAGPRGQISCGFPMRGTNIFVTQGQGAEWIFVSYDQPDSISRYDANGARRISMDKLREGRYVTLVDNDVSVLVDPNDGVTQGDSTNFTQADPILGIWSSRFLQEMHFTESHREITGPVLRDLNSNTTRDIAGSSLTDHPYNSSLIPIGLDPRTHPSVSSSADRNPALAESRTMYYEFVNSFGYTNDNAEERVYAGEDISGTLPYQRKKSRTDTMSLSLDQPNYLAEIIIGTAVDIYGNILDINRNILPNGLVDSLSFRKSQDDKNVVFANLRNQLRKSLAYHFEINARKDDNLSLPDYSNTDNYIRNRSRFFFDTDKEGQFKFNVPASSETGNVPVLVRYDNFSNIKGFEDNIDRGQLLRNTTNNTDIELEPHGVGAVSLISTEDSLKNFAAPVSRLDGSVIKLGTGFHDISGGLIFHKVDKPYAVKEGSTSGYDDSIINSIPAIGNVVSPSITVSGPGANAGGRSGTISLDGMLSFSVGANTIDRQSLWLDCAGGMVAAIGRDIFNRSLAATLDGDLLMQVGGPAIGTDSRFSAQSNIARDGTVDIRIWNSGSFHTIRIDPQGIKIHTPQDINIVSEGEMRFKSVNSNMYFDAESIYFYASDPATSRLVLRATEGAAGRSI
jgi:hypothetical protein